MTLGRQKPCFGKKCPVSPIRWHEPVRFCSFADANRCDSAAAGVLGAGRERARPIARESAYGIGNGRNPVLSGLVDSLT